MKNIKLLVLLFCLSGSLLNAQEEIKEPKNNLKIGLFYSFDKVLSDKNLSSTKYTGYSIDYSRPNYSLGAEIEYYINPKFSIQSGITYTNRDFTATYYCHVCDFIVAPQPESINQEFLEIPLTAKYYFLSKKVLLFAEAGIVNQFTVKNELNENDYAASAKAALGVGYQFGNTYSIEISSNYQNGISNLYKDSNFKQQLLGFKVGIKKRL